MQLLVVFVFSFKYLSVLFLYLAALHRDSELRRLIIINAYRARNNFSKKCDGYIQHFYACQNGRFYFSYLNDDVPCSKIIYKQRYDHRRRHSTAC